MIRVDRERDVDKYFREQVELYGGQQYKFTSPGYRGVADRIVVFPFNRVYFVELKQRVSGRIKKAQWDWACKLLDVGVEVIYLWSRAEVDAWIRKIV